MPYTVLLTATDELDPDAITILAEADTNIADLKWRGASGGHQFASANLETGISANIVEGVMVTDADAQDATSAVIAVVADAIDLTAIAATALNDGTDVDDADTAFIVDDAAFVTWCQAAVTAGGIMHVRIDDEILNVTAGDTNTLTVERGADGSTAILHLDNAAITIYFGATTTVLPLDDPTVWGAAGPADDYLVVICGTEQIKVDCDNIDGTNDFLICTTRGYDGTTAVLHADGVAVTQYIDEATTQFDVDDATTIIVGNHLKIGTAGTEELKVTAKATHRITATRGYASTTAAVIANAGEIWKIYGDDVVATELALGDIPLEQRGDSVSSMT